MKVKLLVVQGRPQGKALLFPPGEFVFGRGQECHIRPNSDWVSRQHCLLRVTDGGAHLRDLGSRNGTLVNGVRLTGECRLQHGDQVQVGPLVFRIELEEVPAAVPAAGPAEGEKRVAVADEPEAEEEADDTEEMGSLETRRAPKREPPG